MIRFGRGALGAIAGIVGGALAGTFGVGILLIGCAAAISGIASIYSIDLSNSALARLNPMIVIQVGGIVGTAVGALWGFISGYRKTAVELHSEEWARLGS